MPCDHKRIQLEAFPAAKPFKVRVLNYTQWTFSDFPRHNISIFSMSSPSKSWCLMTQMKYSFVDRQGLQYQIHASDKAMKVLCLFFCFFGQTLQHDSDPFIGALLHKALEFIPKQVLEMDQDKEFQGKGWELTVNHGPWFITNKSSWSIGRYIERTIINCECQNLACNP